MSIFSSLIPSLAQSLANQTGSSPSATAAPTVKPAYEIKENDDAFGLTVYLPGVTKEGLEITAEEGQFRVTGRRGWKQPQGWTSLYRESSDAPFELVLAHENLVDADKVVADLKDGVLRVSLPKHEAIKPRKITVN